MKAGYLDFLHRLGVFNIKLGLDNIRNLLTRLGTPECHPRIIHFAGTNGKGSTLAALEGLLLRSGFTTGATVSPHLIQFNERFRINGQAAPDEILEEAFREVCQACNINADLLEEYAGKDRLNPTFFEFSLAMAFLVFRRYRVDYILLETGLGGRLDATNIVQRPLACVFTRIALDHQEYLGDTLAEIANEKLGILKPEASVYIAEQELSVADRIRRRCRESGNRYLAACENFQCQKAYDRIDYTLYPSDDPGATPVSKSISIALNGIGLLGDHQLENIATALTIYLTLIPEVLQLGHAGISDCLRNLRWAGRLQYVDGRKRILLDGAHNISGMKSLLDFLRQSHAEDRILFAVSWMKGKEILPAFDFPPLPNVRFQPLETETTGIEHVRAIAEEIEARRYPTLPVCSVSQFVRDKLPKYQRAYDLIVVAGSLYLAGEFLAKYRQGVSTPL